MIESLSDEDLAELRRFASWRMSRYGGCLRGRDCDDLLNEALLAVWAGGRRVLPDKPLKETVKGVMHSIAGGWARRKSMLETSSGLMNSDEKCDDDAYSG